MNCPAIDTFDLGDNALADAAQAASESIQRMFSRWRAFGVSEGRMYASLRGVAQRHSIAMPDKPSLQQIVNRMGDAAWWRRSLRKRFRRVEHAAIMAGRVHRHAGAYVSDHAMRRAVRDKIRVADLLASLVAINQNTGEMLGLDDLAAQSLSNPANRRSALMARIKGIETHAVGKGLEALFLTLTCPSRFHARRTTGQTNDRYDGTGPREANAYLHSTVWRRAMRKLQHEGIPVCGLRVVEPHHDGCPHWHVLVFVEPEHCERVAEIVRSYALCESPNEPGAQEHRFKVERIDPAKGSAVGYVAKYVSKSIDGEGVGLDLETGAAGTTAASRIVAWARLWGIRQFQFFGVPAITPTRELYRLEAIDVDSVGLTAAHQATKGNDYAAWLSACDTYGLRFSVNYADRPSTRYQGEIAQCIKGLTATACDLPHASMLTTRTDEWRVEPKARSAESAFAATAAAPPWTRFNNCAPIDFEGVFATPSDPAWVEMAMQPGADRPPDRPSWPASPDDAFEAWFSSIQASQTTHQTPIFSRAESP